MKKIVRYLFVCHFEWVLKIIRRLNEDWQPRVWSNQELKRIAPLFSGNIINVSGWMDEDKQGSIYRNYFTNAKSYCVSNFPGSRGMSEGGGKFIDLQVEIDPEFYGVYDVVFNHTVLEHLADPFMGVKNLCALTKDIVIIVAPFIQVEHWSDGSYLDYFRFTEFGLENMFERNGMKVVYAAANHNPVFPVYFLIIASKKPDSWQGQLSNMARQRWGEVIPFGDSKYRSLGKTVAMS